MSGTAQRTLRAGLAGLLVALVVSTGYRAGSVAAQSAPAAILLQPAPGIEGVIAAGTRPEVIATGLKGADGQGRVISIQSELET